MGAQWFEGEVPVYDTNGKWTGEWIHMSYRIRAATTLSSLRAPSRYYVVNDAQLKRDLAGRTLDDIYRENRARRTPKDRYVPRWTQTVSERVPSAHGEYRDVEVTAGGLGVSSMSLRDEYLEWCRSRNHTPHPASLDPDHPIAKQRERCPKPERN